MLETGSPDSKSGVLSGARGFGLSPVNGVWTVNLEISSLVCILWYLRGAELVTVGVGGRKEQEGLSGWVPHSLIQLLTLFPNEVFILISEIPRQAQKELLIL